MQERINPALWPPRPRAQPVGSDWSDGPPLLLVAPLLQVGQAATIAVAAYVQSSWSSSSSSVDHTVFTWTAYSILLCSLAMTMRFWLGLKPEVTPRGREALFQVQLWFSVLCALVVAAVCCGATTHELPLLLYVQEEHKMGAYVVEFSAMLVAAACGLFAGPRVLHWWRHTVTNPAEREITWGEWVARVKAMDEENARAYILTEFPGLELDVVVNQRDE